jgi:hypothetical protein
MGFVKESRTGQMSSLRSRANSEEQKQLFMYQTDTNGGIIAFGLRAFAICKISQVKLHAFVFLPNSQF